MRKSNTTFIPASILAFAMTGTSLADETQLSKDVFCIAGYCLGDPMAKYDTLVKWGFPYPKGLANPYCARGTQEGSIEGTIQRDDMEIVLGFVPDPAFAGEPTNQYYRVSSVSTRPSVPHSDVVRQDEVDDFLRNHKELQPSLSNWLANVVGGQVELRVRPTRFDIAFKNARGSAAILGQPLCSSTKASNP